MKKIFNIVALAAVLLGMAACNSDVNLKRFKIAVNQVTANSAHITITPPNEQMYYTYMMLNKGTFDLFQSMPNGLEDAIEIFAGSNGSIDMTMGPMMPNTKYVLCVAEKDEEISHTVIGDVEYVGFQTKSMEPQMAGVSLSMTGECTADLSLKGVMMISCTCPDPESENDKVTLVLYFVSDKLTGHFTTDQLFSYFLAVPNMNIANSKGEVQQAFLVGGADVNGFYNQQSNTYEYNGWFDVYSEDYGLIRFPFTAQCEKN